MCWVCEILPLRDEGETQTRTDKKGVALTNKQTNSRLTRIACMYICIVRHDISHLNKTEHKRYDEHPGGLGYIIVRSDQPLTHGMVGYTKLAWLVYPYMCPEKLNERPV